MQTLLMIPLEKRMKFQLLEEQTRSTLVALILETGTVTKNLENIIPHNSKVALNSFLKYIFYWVDLKQYIS